MGRVGENKQLMNAQDYYTKKNTDIEQLIRQVMKGKQEDNNAQAEEEVKMANVLKQKPETIESLLKFLIYLVLHKEEVPSDSPEGAEKTDV